MSKELFTAIWVESWMSGSHRCSLTRMRHGAVNPDEDITKALEREGILDSTVFVFNGHLEQYKETKN